ncbi:MAG: MBOAT family protein [Deltaproteobacteria bacterium]|nr:MBOAT family protein [Deltaproteobacteria bacterium]MBW2414386.1 MBOAT family protein [Deltaproteobacteria bacterium]
MLFNSLSFAIFLAGVLVLHRLPLSWRVRKLNLLLASYVFYMAWNPPFVVLLWISTLTDWVIARRIAGEQRPRVRRYLLWASLGVNLGLLGFFKYAGFLLDGFVFLVQQAGIDYQPAAPGIILPLGISFYTFQTLSYTFDVYRGRSQPWGEFIDYALYVTFFPQLVAGPIVRSHEFLPQCEAPRRVTLDQWTWGLSLLTLGLFQKVVLADGLLAPVADGLFSGSGQPDFASAWLGTLAFSGQIFCDFSGYSSCAIGIACCLGFRLPENFRYPYAAIGFSDFWRRWHISLSSWLRDYLYIPLGGNRRGLHRAYANLMLTMLIGGLWHGASWTFVVWGGLHGLYLVAERFARAHAGHLAIWQSPPVRLAIGAATFAVVTGTWTFFRARDFPHAFDIASALIGAATAPDLILTHRGFDVVSVGIVMAGLLIAHARLRHHSLRDAIESAPWWIHSLWISLMWVAIFTAPGNDRAFIYFQF